MGFLKLICVPCYTADQSYLIAHLAICSGWLCCVQGSCQGRTSLPDLMTPSASVTAFTPNAIEVYVESGIVISLGPSRRGSYKSSLKS